MIFDGKSHVLSRVLPFVPFPVSVYDEVYFIKLPYFAQKKVGQSNYVTLFSSIVVKVAISVLKSPNMTTLFSIVFTTVRDS